MPHSVKPSIFYRPFRTLCTTATATVGGACVGTGIALVATPLAWSATFLAHFIFCFTQEVFSPNSCSIIKKDYDYSLERNAAKFAFFASILLTLLVASCYGKGYLEEARDEDVAKAEAAARQAADRAAQAKSYMIDVENGYGEGYPTATEASGWDPNSGMAYKRGPGWV